MVIILQTVVEVEDFVKAQPDAIAHSAAKIISRLNAGGEKTTQALKSLCWRLKGLQVEVTFKHCSQVSKSFRKGCRFCTILYNFEAFQNMFGSERLFLH